MAEIATTGKYITTGYCPAGSYRLEKFNGTIWEPLTNGDATAFVVEVEPGMFDQRAEAIEPTNLAEVAQVLREVIHVAAFVPANTAGTQAHITSALNFTTDAGYANLRPKKVVLGNVRNDGTWTLTSTLTIPSGIELDLGGSTLVMSVNSTMIDLGTASKVTNGKVIYNGTGNVFSSGTDLQGALVTASVVISNVAAKSCAPSNNITFISPSTVDINDTAIVDPYSNADLQTNPETIVNNTPMNVGRGATSLLSAKVKPVDLQAFFFRLCAPDNRKGAFDPLVAPFSNTDAISGERAGSALRSIMKAWGTLLNGTHRSQFKSTTRTLVVGTGLLVPISPVGQAGQSLTIPANGLQIGSSVSGRIHIHTYTAGSGFATNLAQIRLSIGSNSMVDLYVELSESRSIVVEWNAKFIDNGGNNLESIGYARVSNATLGTVETKQWGGSIDKTVANAFAAQIKTPSGSNVTVQIYDLVVDK